MQLSIWNALWTVAALVVAALMYTGQVPPKQAISNIASWWLKPFGIRVQWLENPDADRIIRNAAWVAVPLLVVWGGFQFLDLQNMRDGPKALLAVGTICLIGGIAWHLWKGDPAIPSAESSTPATSSVPPEQSPSAINVGPSINTRDQKGGANTINK